ncbi:MAG TPA: insulinase family protein, partial [Pirellulales bacterium]
MLLRPWGWTLVLAAALAVGGSPCLAQTAPAAATAPGQAPKEVIVEDEVNPEEAATPTYDSVRRLDGSTTLAVLSNGLTVIVQENHAAPLATVRCYVKNTGSMYETRWLGAGLSHLVEHLVAGGTNTKRTEDEVSAIIDSFGGATNAYTSTDVTAYFINCPSKQVATAVELIGDSMQRIVFEEAEFHREHGVVQQELHDGETDRGR